MLRVVREFYRYCHGSLLWSKLGGWRGESRKHNTSSSRCTEIRTVNIWIPALIQASAQVKERDILPGSGARGSQSFRYYLSIGSKHIINSFTQNHHILFFILASRFCTCYTSFMLFQALESYFYGCQYLSNIHIQNARRILSVIHVRMYLPLQRKFESSDDFSHELKFD